MKQATELMHRNLGRAVKALRTLMKLDQPEFAEEIKKEGLRTGLRLDVGRETVSRWEHGQRAPSPAHRMALSKIAAKNRHEDLAELFRAPISAWKLVVQVSGWMKED